jgi:hypothetical protein
LNELITLQEHDLQNLIRIELSKLGFTVFRANVGKIKLPDGRWFDTGLPKGFSDLFAIKDGKIFFMEVKSDKGKVSKEQLNFIEQMKKKGCVAGVVRNVEEAIKLVEG